MTQPVGLINALLDPREGLTREKVRLLIGEWRQRVPGYSNRMLDDARVLRVRYFAALGGLGGTPVQTGWTENWEAGGVVVSFEFGNVRVRGDSPRHRGAPRPEEATR